MEDLVKSLDGYVRRTVVVLDNEGTARKHVEALVEAGVIPGDNALIFETSLEEANASPEELVQFAIGIAAGHGVTLSITPEEVRAFHGAALRKAAEKKRELPSLSTSLDRVVSRATSGAWHLRKPELVTALAAHVAHETDFVDPSDSPRPIVRFVTNRIIPPLNRAYPAGAS